MKSCKRIEAEKKRIENLHAREFQKRQDREERRKDPKYEPKVLLSGVDQERRRMQTARDEYRRMKYRRANDRLKSQLMVAYGEVSSLDSFTDKTPGGEGGPKTDTQTPDDHRQSVCRSNGSTP